MLSTLTGTAYAERVAVDSVPHIKAAKKAIIVMAEKDENVIRSAANIPGITTTIVSAMNTYEVLNATSFIVTKEAVQKIEEVYV